MLIGALEVLVGRLLLCLGRVRHTVSPVISLCAKLS